MTPTVLSLLQTIAPKDDPLSGMAPAAPPPPVAPDPGHTTTMVLAVPLVVGVVMMALFAFAAYRTWKRGHEALFLVGFMFPLAGVAGSFVPPPKDGAWIRSPPRARLARVASWPSRSRTS